MRFQVGDWVRRKPEYQDRGTWHSGDAVVQVVGASGDYIETSGGEGIAYRFDKVEAPPELDHFALGMALVLAEEVARGSVRGEPVDYQNGGYVSHWLRACVTEALLSEEG